MNSPSDFLCCSFRKWGTSSLATDVEMFGSKQGLGNKKPTFASQSSLELSSFFWPMVRVFVRKSTTWISFGRETECACALSWFTGVIWLEGRRTWFHSKLIPYIFWISTSRLDWDHQKAQRTISKWCCWVEELYSSKNKTSPPSYSLPTSSAFCTLHFSFPSPYFLREIRWAKCRHRWCTLLLLQML